MDIIHTFAPANCVQVADEPDLDAEGPEETRDAFLDRLKVSAARAPHPQARDGLDRE